MAIRDDVLATLAVMSNNPSADEGRIVELLVAQGYDRLRAEVLIAFVPLGLARALIARLPAHPPIHLSKTAQIQNLGSGPTKEVRLTEIPEFQISYELGEEAFTTGIVPQEQFSAASGRSVELILINDALKADENLGGAKMAAPILLRLAEAPGFEEWYRKLRAKTLNAQN